MFFYISVVFLTSDIFLYAQNTKLNKLESLLQNNDLDLFNNSMIKYYKDTINFNEDDKIYFHFLSAQYFYKKDLTELALKEYKKLESYYLKNNQLEKLYEVKYQIFKLLKTQKKLKGSRKAQEYLDHYFEFAKKNNLKNNLLKAYLGYASLSINKLKVQDALNYYNKAESISIQINDSLSLAKIYSNKGVIIKKFYKNLDSARSYYIKAIPIYSKLNLNNKLFNVHLNISSSFKKENKYKKAIAWLKKADSIPIKSYRINSKKFLYRQMSINYSALKDYKNAFTYLEKYLAYKDSLDIKEQNIAITDIQTKYETEKKEKAIIQLNAIRDRQESYLIIGSLIFFGTLIFGVLLYNIQKRKRVLAEKEHLLEHQKLVSLMKQQEVKTLDAIVIGQEKERKRIAEDLHDNLGSKLAVLKLQFDSFVENAIKNNNKKELLQFKNTSNLLDDTYQTVRSIAHTEMHREIHQSLAHTVKSLALNISNTNKINIEVLDYGLENPIHHKLEILVLRIVQELITNIIKYANAKNATIDLSLFENIMNIIISDDGIGFDGNKIDDSIKGMGLKSIKDRVSKINGIFTIDSSIGNGTTIIIEIPINTKNI